MIPLGLMKSLLWIDLEMTGLDDAADHILEIAAVVTDLDMKPLDQFHRVIFQTPEVVAGMNDWCKKTHGESGLTAQIPSGTPLPQAEQELIAWLDKHFHVKERVILAGNSIGNDRRFIDRYMKEFTKRLHYRMIDVSSYKEIFREKYGVQFEKKNTHRAVDDIFESIAELNHYLSFVNVPAKPETKA